MDDVIEFVENGFESLGLKQGILDALQKAGFKTPSPIQQEVIPLILAGSDVIGHAQTGTGKTAAFALPALHMLKNTGSAEVLVITPTRELASQVSEEISRLGSFLRARTATVYGGKSFFTQIDAIKRGAHVVVATPGRLLDLLQGGKIGAFNPKLVVIDEADEMLDMGFLEDLQAIFEFLPKERQTLMFSATMPPAIQALAKKILNNPVVVKAAQTQATSEDIKQQYCILQDYERDEAIIRLFEADELTKAIIFCKTKKEVDRLSQVLTQRGQMAAGLHGDMEQSQRESVTQAFRTGKSKILVATDVAARGLNIVDVSHVINYHIPFDVENYVHRIGRTGRAGRKGISITFVTPREYSRLLQFQRITKGELERFFIPSKKEIRKSQILRLLGQVKDQSVDGDISHVIAGIQKEMGLEVLSAKLLTWILSKNPIEGPESIGYMDTPPKKQEGSYSSRERRPHSGRRPPVRPNAYGAYPKKSFSPFKKKK
jgi:ATP-dependent RNA helicase DeaD